MHSHKPLTKAQTQKLLTWKRNMQVARSIYSDCPCRKHYWELQRAKRIFRSVEEGFYNQGREAQRTGAHQ